MQDRSEIWAATLDTTAAAPGASRASSSPTRWAKRCESPFRNYQCSYIDVFPVGDVLHLFVPHRWRQVLHLTLPEAALSQLPTRRELA